MKNTIELLKFAALLAVALATIVALALIPTPLPLR